MKKKLFVLFALLACITTANAQIYVGGSFGFTSTTIDSGGSDESGSSFKIIPDVGYQIDDKLSVGVQVGYSHGMASFGSISVTDIKSLISTMAGAYIDINNEDMKLNGFTISPYVRYVALDFGKANLFVEGYIGYNSITTDSTPKVGSSGSGGNKATLNAVKIHEALVNRVVEIGRCFLADDAHHSTCQFPIKFVVRREHGNLLSRE